MRASIQLLQHLVPNSPLAPDLICPLNHTMKVASCLIALVFSVSQAAGQGTCYADQTNPIQNFGTKTSYNYVKNLNTSPISLPGCAPAQLWFFSRHGTRYPRLDIPTDYELANLMERMPIFQSQVLDNHQQGRGDLCAKDLDNLRAWKITFDETNDEKLHPAGEDELENIGRRYSARLPGLLSAPYSAAKYTFKFTTASRTKNSCRAFSRGVWGSSVESGINYPTPIEPHDPVIRWYKLCTKWLDEIDNNTDSRIESARFLAKPETINMVENVSNRLGFTAFPLTYDDVQLIWTQCRYDKAFNFNATSAWCAAFSDEDNRVLQYVEDLVEYYVNGYGHDINWQAACNPVVDVFNYFTAVVNGATSRPNALLYFSHSGADSQMLARWGIFNDTERLTADNFATQSDRQWNTTTMETFATHTAFVLFKCGVNYKVQLYVNERQVDIPGCSAGACTFEEFANVARPIVDTCDFDAICENPPAFSSIIA